LEELLKEVLSFVEGDVRWWDEAAQHVEELASALPESERTKWNLLAAVYQERAKASELLADSDRDQRANVIYNVDRIGFCDDEIDRRIGSHAVFQCFRVEGK